MAVSSRHGIDAMYATTQQLVVVVGWAGFKFPLLFENKNKER
jgi:hypothetical protein